MFKLLEHQETTIKFGLQNKYCIYGLGPGLGKTLCALETFNRLGGRLLVISPSYLVQNWKNEVKKFYGDRFQVTTIQESKKYVYPFDSDIAITSYDLATKIEELFLWPTLVVIDECHYLKEMSTQRTKTIHQRIYEYSIKRLILLSGTVIKNRVSEMYSPLALCSYSPEGQGKFLDAFPDQARFADYFSFRHEFDLPVGKRFVRIVKWSGFKNQDIFFSITKEFYIRFDTEDVLSLEPTIFEEVHASTLPDPLLESEYEAWKENAAVSPDRKAQVALEKIKFTAQVVKSKIEEGRGPIVVFTDHRASAKALAEALKCPFVTGETLPNQRMALADKFQRGELEVLVATIGSFSTGVNLTASSQLIFNDYPWVPGDLEQAIYRIRRIGQDKQCYVTYVLGSPQDAHILKVLREKAKVISEVNSGRKV